MGFEEKIEINRQLIFEIIRKYHTTKDMGHAGGRISLLSGVSKRRNDTTAFIANTGESSVGKLHACVYKTAGTISQTPERVPAALAGTYTRRNKLAVFLKFLPFPRFQPLERENLVK